MLGDKVKFLRKKVRITQQQLAIDIGVSQSTIGMIEENKQVASNETLIKLANALNTTVDYLFCVLSSEAAKYRFDAYEKWCKYSTITSSDKYIIRNFKNYLDDKQLQHNEFILS